MRKMADCSYQTSSPDMSSILTVTAAQ